MTLYELYAESGPKHRKTYIHVPQILGCVARGATTEEAVANTPAEIRRFLRFLRRHREDVDPEEDIEVRIAEHITEGISLGDGYPYVTFATDFEPLDSGEVDRQLLRVREVMSEIGAWARSQSPESLDAQPPVGRPAQTILLHILGPQGSILAAAFGRAPGFGPIKAAAKSGELPIDEALLLSWEKCAERVKQATPDEWNSVRQMTGYVYTLRNALRRMIEHPWEHFVELSERPGGPVL